MKCRLCSKDITGQVEMSYTRGYPLLNKSKPREVPLCKKCYDEQVEYAKATRRCIYRINDEKFPTWKGQLLW